LRSSVSVAVAPAFQATNAWGASPQRSSGISPMPPLERLDVAARRLLFPAVGLLPFIGGSQSAVEEFGSGAVGADPIAPAEQVVNFVGED